MSLTAAQLEFRRQGIGASESPCIIGVSPFGGPISVWASKMGLEIQEETDAMALGNFLEDGIARFYAAKTGRELLEVGTIIHHKRPHMLATPDRHVMGERRIVQIKLVGTWMAHHWEAGCVPDYVEVQVQHEMEVADVDACDVVAVLGGTEVRIETVERDRKTGGELADVCEDFWSRYVATGEMPEPDGSEEADDAIRTALRGKPRRPEALFADERAERWGRAWLTANDELKSAETRRATAAQQLQMIMGEHLVLEGQDFRASWSKENAKGNRSFTVKALGEKVRAA